MIIKLTSKEVKNFVGLALNMSGLIFDLEIVDEENAVLAAFRSALTEFPRHLSDQKIACIKRFRELVGRDARGELLGLGDCKWAVENPASALRSLELTGKLCRPSSY